MYGYVQARATQLVDENRFGTAAFDYLLATTLQQIEQAATVESGCEWPTASTSDIEITLSLSFAQNHSFCAHFVIYPKSLIFRTLTQGGQRNFFGITLGCYVRATGCTSVCHSSFDAATSQLFSAGQQEAMRASNVQFQCSKVAVMWRRATPQEMRCQILPTDA